MPDPRNILLILPLLPWLARSENGLPQLFLTPGPMVRLDRGGEATYHLRNYEDVEALELNHNGAFSRRALIDRGDNPHPLMDAPWFSDLENHSRYRQAIKAPFRSTEAEYWTGIIEREVGERIRVVREMGEFQLHSDFGQPFALGVISQIIGAHPGDIPQFMGHLARVTELENMNQYPDEAGLNDILDRIIDAHLRGDQPAEGAFGHVVSLYRAGYFGEAEEGRNTLRGYLASLLFAGTDTVAMTLCNVVLGLRRWGMWEAAVKAARDGDDDRLDALIEEAMRLDLAFPASAARVIAPVTLPSGARPPVGSVVVGWLSAANRDPAVFDEPNRFRLGRKVRHLGFGNGPHVCLGAELAKLELRIAFKALVTELPGFRPKPGVKWKRVLGRVKRLSVSTCTAR